MSNSPFSDEEREKRIEEIREKIRRDGVRRYSGTQSGGIIFNSLNELEKDGVLTSQEIAFLTLYGQGSSGAEEVSSDPAEYVSWLMTKIMSYQKLLPKDRGVDLKELEESGVFTAADLEFMKTHSVKYKPHKLSDYHAGDMFEIPTNEGCQFIGPAGPDLIKRTASFKDFRAIMENFLKLPSEDLLMHVEFVNDGDGMGVSPGSISFFFESSIWRERLPAIRAAAGELGLSPCQDREFQESWMLAFSLPQDALITASVAYALLREGCGYAEERELVYSAGALDEVEKSEGA